MWLAQASSAQVGPLDYMSNMLHIPHMDKTEYPIKKIIGFTQPMIEAIEKWRAKQRPIPTVSEAIRRLIELGLKAKQ
jgi:hypothetical protein